MSTIDLAYISASQALRLFAEKSLSPVELLQAQIDRAEEVEPRINAFAFEHFDEALQAAKDSEQRYVKGNPKPLDGITVALKDEHDKAGWKTTCGSMVTGDNVASTNDPIVDKLMEAGAILHAQTTVPEMYFAGVTWTRRFGITRNPWNLTYSCGGSSGGSGAALAAGTTTMATGSDMGGSIRIPSAFNGLYGFKPPYGRVPLAPHSTFLFPSASGPMARSFNDMVRLQNVISGPAPRVATSLRPKLELPGTYDDVAGWRIAYSPDQSWAEIDPAVSRNTERALGLLEDQGAVVEEVDLDLGIDGQDIRSAISKALLHGPFGADMANLLEYSDQLTSYARYFAEIASRGMGPAQALEAANFINDVYARLEAKVFLNGYKALVMPTLATPYIRADFDPVNDHVSINGKAVEPNAGWSLTALFNLLNWNPVISVPTGLADKNMPTGMQIVTETYDDISAMKVASTYASAAPALFIDGAMPDFRSDPANSV